MRLNILVLALAVFVTLPALAQNTTVTGNLYASEAPLGSARVDILRADQVLASATANPAGRYTLSLPQGQYTVRVTPPTETNLQPESFQKVSFESDEAIFDAYLLSAGAEIQGTVRGLNGAPLPNVTVDARSKTERVVARTRTGPDGRYRFIARGTVSLQFTSTPNANAPSSWTASQSSVTGPATIDINLPTLTLTGTVRGIRGIEDEPFAASVNVQTTSDSQPLQFTSSGISTTGPDGKYSVVVLSGNGVVNVFPLDMTKQTAFTQLVFNLEKDAVRDVKAPSPTAIRGVVRGIERKPIANANVQAHSKVGDRLLGQTKTDADGRYTLYVNGSVDLRFSGAGSPYAPSSWNLRRRDIDPSLSFSVDVDLPVVKVSGTVKTKDGNPIPNVSLTGTIRLFDNEKKTEGESSLELRTAADGTYSGIVFKGSLTMIVRHTAASGLVPILRALPALDNDSVQDFMLGSGNTLNGTVYGFGRNPVPGASVYVLEPSSGQVLSQTRTNAAGQYTISADGTVSLGFNGGAPMRDPPPYTPLSWNFFIHSIDASKPSTVDAILPVVQIRGIVTDAMGAPAKGGQIAAIVTKADGARPDFLTNGATPVKEDGTFSFLLFRGNGEFSIGETSDTRFPPLSLPQEFRGDSTRHIRLQNPPDPQ